MGGVKYDQEKLKLDLIPPEAFKAMGSVLTMGAAKYGDRNWEQGMDWSRVYAAALRHIVAWQGGESKDPESGYSHLWHATINLVFLLTYEDREIGKDFRE